MSQKQLFQDSATNKLLEATKANPCPHCGKPNWCCLIGCFTVCNRDRFHQPNYALGQPKQSPTYVLSNCQKLNNVQGGIA
ncbi:MULTISPECIES: hypothetical protein [Nostoc]|uniref:Uncharacterized protein n=1 Tax=Nostoc paludosum FACHB-159 TaxID=2692908 RepID=A0ABR8KKF7_9NOSO|nr:MULTISPECIES: hypothetical protein [Nostoc]MBD2682208.1 hypothetical protein [Nostoc sp. FACHB-857]MBD2738537.1 hypothetical protein [Nostoc paludosum FACHB-159]